MIRHAAIMLGICLSLLQATGSAQGPPVLVSPEVRPDRMIVFRFWAPMAKEVQLSGDWMGGPPVPLARDAQGNLVLLPGTPGDETEWTSGGGSAEIVLDNLIAEGRMTPAIVVMHASDVDTRARARRGDDNLAQFEKILVDELVPLVRRRYPVKTDPSSWAIAGLSLGGEFGMYAGLRHPELFGSIGSISGSLVPRGDDEDGLPSMDERFGPALARSDVSRNYKLIWIGCGTGDNVCRGSRVFAQRLEAAKWVTRGESTPERIKCPCSVVNLSISCRRSFDSCDRFW